MVKAGVKRCDRIPRRTCCDVFIEHPHNQTQTYSALKVLARTQQLKDFAKPPTHAHWQKNCVIYAYEVSFPQWCGKNGWSMTFLLCLPWHLAFGCGCFLSNGVGTTTNQSKEAPPRQILATKCVYSRLCRFGRFRTPCIKTNKNEQEFVSLVKTYFRKLSSRRMPALFRWKKSLNQYQNISMKLGGGTGSSGVVLLAFLRQ